MGRDGCRMKSGDAWCGLRKRVMTVESISYVARKRRRGDVSRTGNVSETGNGRKRLETRWKRIGKVGNVSGRSETRGVEQETFEKRFSAL